MPLESSVLEGPHELEDLLPDHQRRLIERGIKLALDLPVPKGRPQEGDFLSFEDLPRPKPEEFLPLKPYSRSQLIQIDS